MRATSGALSGERRNFRKAHSGVPLGAPPSRPLSKFATATTTISQWTLSLANLVLLLVPTGFTRLRYITVLHVHLAVGQNARVEERGKRLCCMLPNLICQRVRYSYGLCTNTSTSCIC